MISITVFKINARKKRYICMMRCFKATLKQKGLIKGSFATDLLRLFWTKGNEHRIFVWHQPLRFVGATAQRKYEGAS